jgi:hypothetical protein
MSCFHRKASKLIREATNLRKKVNDMAVKRAKHEGADKDKRMQEPPYNGQLQPYAMARLSYYM